MWITKQDLDIYASEIQKSKEKEYKLTVRELIWAFEWERRTPRCQSVVNSYLEEHNLEVIPDYTTIWIDAEITLRHKAVAQTSVIDPVKKISLLDSAHNEPLTVKKEDLLSTAITQMSYNDYSQLLVCGEKANVKGIDGYISWETIGKKLLASHPDSNIEKFLKSSVKKFMSTEVCILREDDSLLEAITKVYEHGFAVVGSKDTKLLGIVTTTDISSEFLKITKPFLLLQQIENYIRQLLHNNILKEDIEKLCDKEQSKSIACLDDLSFGHYIRILENDKNWKKLNISINKKIFLEYLDNARKIRNDIAHFAIGGDIEDQCKPLHALSNLLASLVTIK